MTDALFALVWVLSFGLYLLIYTYWIPLRTQEKIESWLMSEESNETLLASLGVITDQIRNQTLVDFEEVMIPQARKAAIDFWNGAMGNAAKELGKSEEGSQLSIMHNMAKELEGQPWYVQMLSSKLIPLINKAAEAHQGNATAEPMKRLGLRK
jgi:hypothetical protein|tara:strand:- start:40 stop:498 length:459 start_codon:yes stop_codon:yes gene_type:complete